MITDNTAKWKAVKITEFAGKSLPVGFMHFSLEKEVPAGELPAFGYLYNRTLYADLWAYAQERGLVVSESEWQAVASANGGYCEYYSSGDDSTTFRVPKLPNTIASDVPSEVPVVGNGMTVGLTGYNDFLGGLTYNPNNYIGLAIGGNNYGAPANQSTPNAGSSPANAIQSIGVTTDSTKSGIVAKMSATKITGQWLIVAFGVAHNIGEADIANVMQAIEQVQTSVGTLEQGVGTAIDYIVESYRNGTEWYEVYKSGKIRQGGNVPYQYDGRFVTFLKQFADTKYQLFAYPDNSHVGSNWNTFGVNQNTKTTTSIEIKIEGDSSNPTSYNWVAEGQGA